MKSLLTIAWCMILPGVVNAQLPQKNDGPTATALLGTWQELESRSSDNVISESTYTKEGLLLGSGSLPVRRPDEGQRDMQFKVRSHWKLDERTLLIDHYETIPSGIIPPASVQRLEVASLTRDELVLRSPVGGKERYSRRKVNADTLRFDGVYQAFSGGGSQSLYLRFYPDGYVVAMSYAGSPDEVAKFISRRYSELPQGKYDSSESKVAFTTKAERGENDYAGTISGENIACHLHSRITGAAADLPFVFWKAALSNDSTLSGPGTEALPADAYRVPPSAEH